MLPSRPLRSDGDVVKPYRRGSKQVARAIAADPSQLQATRSAFEARVYAASHKGGGARLELWNELAILAGHPDPLALDPAIIYDVGASLWGADYRTVRQYLSTAKQEMALAHGSIPRSMEIHFKRAIRAAERGLGPAKQATELELR